MHTSGGLPSVRQRGLQEHNRIANVYMEKAIKSVLFSNEINFMNYNYQAKNGTFFSPKQNVFPFKTKCFFVKNKMFFQEKQVIFKLKTS